LLGSFLAGCGGIPVTEVKATLSAAKPCCTSLADVAYKKLETGNRSKFEITTASPALQSSEGLAYFAAFQLPQDAARIEVQALNTPFLPKATYPDPLVVVLDSQHRRVSEVKDLPLVRGRHTILPGLFEYHYAATLTLPADARYVIVFARPNSVREQPAVSDNGTFWSLPSAPVGTLALVAR
jgi:hypothetical protein